MAFHKSICFLLLIFITFMSSSHAHTFQVGGKDGWTLHPSENYNSWSGRLRFLINDTLHFKYDDGSDSVLVVNKSDYDGCNVNNPITKLDGGDSSFKFDRSGPFYFITGNKSNCDQGQKLTVVVLALRKRSPPPSIATPPSSSTLPPSPVGSPVFPPSKSPVSPPSTAVSPVFPPYMSPVSPPSTAVSPVFPPSMSPVSPPTTAVSPVFPPSMSPISPPTAGSPKLSPFGTPSFSPPAPSPGGGSADSPAGESADSPAGGGSASPPGGGGMSPGGSPGANSTTPSSAATPPLFGITVTSLVTVTLGLSGLI
ncbi:putative Phytocyanin domain, cupredoxin [Helianthus annuus]|uniref:Putative cupredoxin n=1 Tax=Helianthus annuus TaxID=4232 RepID=A0A251T196_HELAN|nr:early nodulin-like protein 2 [Helianthus annuus]KAJ0593389.1 putative Phytocyanin domain, cupredoxin [Helianthus annuus]KAJ0608399.1 putative Phytocyanin domain, cupredoxin [Helianthus annuus]KAJ0629612.1 putative Phytocyanin domain, cupredoxin [Helianthus annuus]KAJ0768463.1 putative Phytocyanin domain, cupredoxin [Helianthus annuus]KAJ0774213.1 putative Phytocyanin domain, cupredoxin [Helianthus annuus]